MSNHMKWVIAGTSLITGALAGVGSYFSGLPILNSVVIFFAITMAMVALFLGVGDLMNRW